MMCADLDISILNRRDAPLIFAAFLGTFLIGFCGIDMALQPKMRLIVGSGQGEYVSGQIVLAMCHICFLAGLLHSIRMCSIVSLSSPQVLHLALCLNIGICSQKSPIW